MTSLMGRVAATTALQTQSVPDVAAMLGLANPSITMRVRAHVLPGSARRVASANADTISG
ncbi:MAG: hypothetical protein IH867_12595 [Chloroflexi bacterium]|nr:hypothetical protein [Chloroflexota bacterium]